MDRLDLVPRRHRAERLFLLDVLANTHGELSVDAGALAAVTPKKLHPFLYARLRHEAFAAAYRASALQELRRGAELRRLDAALDAAQIPFLILKGPVLAELYPDRASRTMTDLDLLLSEDDLPRAMDALGGAGYRVPAQFAGVEMAAGDAPPLIHEQPGGPSIELHTMLDSLPDERRAFETLWPSARRVPVGHGLELMTLERGAFFAHVVLHVSKHHRFEGELRSLLDVALLLRGEALDWPALLAAWERAGLAEWIVLTVSLAHVLLHAPVPAALAGRTPSDEAMRLAAEQLWIIDKAPVHQRITHTVAGHRPAPVHANVAATRAPMPGLRAHASRELTRARRVFSDLRRGVLRPRMIASEVDLFRKRERLFALVEGVSDAHPLR